MDARIQQRHEQMEAGTFRDEPQDMLDMMLPSFQQDLGVSENVVYTPKPNGFADHYPY